MRDGSVEHYERLFGSMEFLPAKKGAITRGANRLIAGRVRYQAVGAAVGMPWPVVGATHGLECSYSWEKGLHCGTSWRRVTRLVPAGKGPFDSWEAAAVDALDDVRRLRPDLWDGVAGWSAGEMGKFLEKYNGAGYMRRDKESPYLWSYSNHGVGTGKYVVDGRYDPDAVSRQVGAMVLIGRVMDLTDWRPGEAGDTPDEFSGRARRGAVRRLQRFLNSEMREGEERLVVDGVLGAMTRLAWQVYSDRFPMDR